MLATIVAAFFVFRVADAGEANLVLLEDAVNTGAVCLDGSPPGYYFRPGKLIYTRNLKRFLKEIHQM